MFPLFMAGAFALTSFQVFGQYPAVSHEDSLRRDSLATLHQREQQAGVSDAEKNSSENLEDLKSEKNNTKAEAKEAQRVERKANAAARESRSAYRAEKKAQRARVRADRQAEKAARARRISDNR